MIGRNKRIAINVLVTYARSVLSLLSGLFTVRWVLNTLGEVDFGLYGVLAGLTGVITFFNGLLGGAVGRFYAVSAGAANAAGGKGEALEECRRWFNTALSVHTLTPLILIVIGYPICAWAIRNFMTIPPDRVDSCIWVFRFACASCFISMVNVPFQAMYVAKQYIAEVTVYTMLQTIGNFLFVYYMVSHPGKWLVKYALGMCLISVIPQILIMVNAAMHFPECRIRMCYLWKKAYLSRLFKFAFWQFWGACSALVRAQGFPMLVNKAFGPVFNASMNIANNVAGQSNALSSALGQAFSPAVSNLMGEGDKDRMLRTSYRANKFCAVLCLVFVLPLWVEIDTVLELWLKNPPPMASVACQLTFATLIVTQMYKGIDMAINAYGRVGEYNFWLGLYNVCALPIAIGIVIFANGGFASIFWVLFVSKLGVALIALPIAHRIVGYSISNWIVGTFIPVVISTAAILLVGYVVHYAMAGFFWLRIVSVGIASEIMLGLCMMFILDRTERLYFKGCIMHVFSAGRIK